MTRYRNLSGNSGVLAYKIGEDYIIVEFQEGGTYLYNYKRPGKNKVERMKELAIAGRGLSTYISRHVKDNYASKLR